MKVFDQASQNNQHRGCILITLIVGSAVLSATAGVAANPVLDLTSDFPIKKHLIAEASALNSAKAEKAIAPYSSNASLLLPQPTSQLAPGITLSQLPEFQTQTVQEQPLAQQPTPSVSPELQQLRQQYLLKEPETIEVPTLGAAAAPGSSSGSPTAFGASWGKAFAGVGFQARTRYTEKSDGSLSIGMGFGDAKKTVGVEVTAAVLSLLGDDAFERGGISFKVHRLLPEDFAVAVGLENAIVWGSTDAGSSVYGVVSKVFRLKKTTKEPFSQITVSLGLGSGRFRSEDNIEDDKGSVNVFGSVGLRVAEPVSLIADWTGQDLTLGASIAPFRDVPLVITPAITDITGNAGDGARFILGIGYSYSFPTGSR